MNPTKPQQTKERILKYQKQKDDTWTVDSVM